MAGFSLVLHCQQAPLTVRVSSSGRARRIASERFTEVMTACPGIRTRLSPYGQVLAFQMAATARSSVRRSIDARSARWILMAVDRGDSNDVAVTHDEMATALRVRRPGVTVALHVLEGLRLIRSSRGCVRVTDREGLEAFTHGAYGRPEAEYRRLYPARSDNQPTDGADRLPEALAA